MAGDNFQRAMKILRILEGGTTTDEGGLTKCGISQRQYPDLDIASLTDEQIAAIYERDYWNVVHGDDLPWPLCVYVFDAAVNQGCDLKAGFAAQKMLQRALNTTQDGILGSQTISLAQKSRPWHALRFLAIRALRYGGTRNFDKNGEGWYIRLFNLTTMAQEAA